MMTEETGSSQAVFVVFDLGDGFDRDRLTRIAHEARSMFEGMPGLRLKVFTIDEPHHRATNFYLWDSPDYAQAFFTPAMVERITQLYGVEPSVTFADIAVIVDNAATDLPRLGHTQLL